MKISSALRAALALGCPSRHDALSAAYLGATGHPLPDDCPDDCPSEETDDLAAEMQYVEWFFMNEKRILAALPDLGLTLNIYDLWDSVGTFIDTTQVDFPRRKLLFYEASVFETVYYCLEILRDYLPLEVLAAALEREDL